MPLIAVAGMWHLGPVTAACLASVGHQVVAIDEDPGVVAKLNQAQPPVDEPRLASMIARQIAEGRLRFSADFAEAALCDIVWIAYDTPVDDNDVADVEFVYQQVQRLLPHVQPGAVVVVSSQLPAGSVARMERKSTQGAEARRVHFACVPENLRLGKAIEVFLNPDRVVLGVRDPATQSALEAVFAPITNRLEWMSVESAEMTKHAINAFLGTSICFINEIATLCEAVGADAVEVERGMKTDQRIGQGAYLHAGGAIAGGTLARDVMFLQSLGRDATKALPLIDGVRASNQGHKTWLKQKVLAVFGELTGRTIALLGLTYKPGTNTLRRSAAIEMARWLRQSGAAVQAFDPQISELPEDLRSSLSLASNFAAALHRADALILMTPWPEFQSLDLLLCPPVVFDPGRFLEQLLRHRPDIQYHSIGRAH